MLDRLPPHLQRYICYWIPKMVPMLSRVCRVLYRSLSPIYVSSAGNVTSKEINRYLEGQPDKIGFWGVSIHSDHSKFFVETYFRENSIYKGWRYAYYRGPNMIRSTKCYLHEKPVNIYDSYMVDLWTLQKILSKRLGCCLRESDYVHVMTRKILGEMYTKYRRGNLHDINWLYLFIFLNYSQQLDQLNMTCSRLEDYKCDSKGDPITPLTSRNRQILMWLKQCIDRRYLVILQMIDSTYVPSSSEFPLYVIIYQNEDYYLRSEKSYFDGALMMRHVASIPNEEISVETFLDSLDDKEIDDHIKRILERKEGLEFSIGSHVVHSDSTFLEGFKLMAFWIGLDWKDYVR